MSGRTLSPGHYAFDDVETGDTWSTGQTKITAELIDRFADLTGDRFAIHMDEEAARRFGFERRVAHGLLVLSLVDGLKNQAPVQMLAIASLGWKWSFIAPVLVGHRIGARITVVGVRRTSNPERGILELSFLVRDADGKELQSGVNHLMVQRRGE